MKEYVSKAGSNGIWDLKAQVPKGKTAYFGSNLYGKYASARDVGNFAAGAVSEKSPVPNIFTNYGFGLYNQSGNNKRTSVLMGVADVTMGIVAPPIGIGILLFRANFGEDKLSKQGITAGQKYFSK